jgi:hypothetical protein
LLLLETSGFFRFGFDHNGSDDGGRDEFLEFCPSCASNFATRVSNFAIRAQNRAMTSFASSSVLATGGTSSPRMELRTDPPIVKFSASQPGRAEQLLRDNLNTHNPKNDRWLARHPNIHSHLTPTHASWLNQIGVWLSMLSRRASQGQSFTSPHQVCASIDRLIEAYNATAHPFH